MGDEVRGPCFRVDGGGGGVGGGCRRVVMMCPRRMGIFMCVRVHVLSEAAEPVVSWVRVSLSPHTPPPSEVGTHPGGPVRWLPRSD